MIQARELMIGNYCFDDNGNVLKVTVDTFRLIGDRKIEEIGSFSFSVKNDKRIILEPIPITEEWLLKFGFLEMSGIPGKVYRFGLTFIKVEDDGNYYYLIAKGYNRKIDFVHQLQNLYSALEQKQLKYEQ